MKKSQNQSMDAVSNCEAYMCRLLRKDKSSCLTSGFKQTGNNVKQKSNINKYSSKSKLAGKCQSSNHTGKCYMNCGGVDNVTLHKDIHMDTLGSEIQVKLKPRPRSRSKAAGDREPWGKMLHSTNNENSSKFSNFDPLRTLHFLAKELQNKIHHDLPDDDIIQQMIVDMQHALTRIPPEVASAIKLQHSSDNLSLRKSSSTNSVPQSKRSEEERNKSRSSKSCQTLQKFEDIEMIQKIMEGSTMKLEASCRQMEMFCDRLKSEKEDLEEQLETERENVKFLKKRVGDLELQTDQLVSVTIRKLEEEKNELQHQVNKLTDIVDSQSVHTSYELKSVTQELKQVQMKAEQECGKLKHQLALANMEKEKYIAILSVRDKQINEIRSEMSQLQDVVNEQLMDIHNTALTELPSTNSLDSDILMKKNDAGEGENQFKLSLSANRNPDQRDNQSFQDLPSGEPTLHNGQTEENHAQPMASNKQSIRNMFDELKKQALEVTSISAK